MPETQVDKGPRDLLGLSRDGLAGVLSELGLPAFRAKQIWHWIYYRGVTSFNDMTTLTKPLRQQLGELFYISRPAVAREQTSSDHTRKWLVGFDDGKCAETVFIPEEDRGALCISSQVGCTLNCVLSHGNPALGSQPDSG